MSLAAIDLEILIMTKKYDSDDKRIFGTRYTYEPRKLRKSESFFLN